MRKTLPGRENNVHICRYFLVYQSLTNRWYHFIELNSDISDGTQVDLDFRTPPPADGGNMGRLFATQLGKINGQYYVFGGFKAHYAIYSVDGCEMEELPVKLKVKNENDFISNKLF